MQEIEDVEGLPGVTTVNAHGRVYHIVGTAHVSRHSVEEVRRAVEKLNPDCICVELDGERLDSLRNPTRWDKLDLAQAIRKGRGPFLMVNMAMSAFQRKMGLSTGVKPGEELFEAVKAGEERGLVAELIDRNIKTTLLRAWRKTGFWKKNWLISSLLASAFDDTKIDEEELAKLKSKDMLTALMEEMGTILPTVKSILIDERDTFMAGKLQRAKGERIVAVVGAGHVAGMIKELQREISDEELNRLDTVPPKTLLSKALPWIIPLIVVGLFVAGFFLADPSKVKEAALAWALTTGTLSALGTILALGHPATILTAFLAAPITTLHPAIGVGVFTGVVQAWAGKPKVHDAEALWEDLSHWKGWWTNRVSRVLMVFFFSSLGASIGTFIAFKWLKDLVAA